MFGIFKRECPEPPSNPFKPTGKFALIYTVEDLLVREVQEIGSHSFVEIHGHLTKLLPEGKVTGRAYVQGWEPLE